MAADVFAVPVFLVVFREALETVIIISILFAFLKQTLDGPQRDVEVYKKLVRQVWLGTGFGLLLCLIIGGAIIGVFYTVGSNKWDTSEFNYEGAFALIASVIITIVGVALLRVGKMQEKWRVRLASAIEKPIQAGGRRGILKRFFEKYFMFMLPFITVLREGIEAIVFVAGVTFSAPATSVPLPVIIGLIVGAVVGYLIYKSGSTTKLQVFLVISTCVLYLVAAGLFSRAVWSFEQQQWNNLVGGDAAELGDGAGSYDVDKSVWHVNCCSPFIDGGSGWGFFNAIFGWNNSATYGSVISYNLYWLFVIVSLFIMRYHETRGRYPFFKAKKPATEQEVVGSSDRASGSDNGGLPEKSVAATEKASEPQPTTVVERAA
ncbi:iron permease FTR1 family protein [Thozetella sp. PMI_491]|nr:iron permease FTR1 family protein [Thozetella sp. PMI_491]